MLSDFFIYSDATSCEEKNIMKKFFAMAGECTHDFIVSVSSILKQHNFFYSKVDTLIIVHLSNTSLWRMFLNMLKDNR